MATPLEEAVLKAFIDSLRDESVDHATLDGLQSAFRSERLPAADIIVELVKSQSGDRLA